MNPGKFNKKIRFYFQAEYGGDSALKTQRPQPFKEVWASVKATGGGESYEMQRLTNTVAYDIRTRFSKSLLDPNLIIEYGGERLEIKSVVDVREEHKELAFTCVKIIKGAVCYEY